MGESLHSINWEQLVTAYGDANPEYVPMIETAKHQAEGLRGTPDYWEAVYTLTRQAVQMRDARAESAT